MLIPASGNWRGTVGDGFTPEDFRAYVAGLTYSAWRPQGIVLHNTGAPTLVQWKATKGGTRQRLLNLTGYYRDQMHWMAGPHLFIDDQRIWVFTPLNARGTHSPSWNATHWGIEMVGDYAREAFNPNVRDLAVQAMAIMLQARGLSTDTIRFHKEDPLTDHDCPGKNVKKPDMIARVKNAMIGDEDNGDHTPAPKALVPAPKPPVLPEPDIPLPRLPDVEPIQTPPSAGFFVTLAAWVRRLFQGE